MSMTKSQQQQSTLVPIPLTRHNDVIVIEKRFGYDRLGIIISLVVICFLIVLICIPTALEYFGDDFKQINNIVLVSLIVVLILVSLGILLFMNFQHKQAKKQRINSTYGIYTLERQRMRRNQSRGIARGGEGKNENSTSMIELQSLKLDLNSNEKKHKIRQQHHHYHIPADNDSHSTTSSSKKTALLLS